MPALKSKVVTPRHFPQADGKPKAVRLVKGRKVVYDRIFIKLHDGVRDPMLTAAEAKQLVGWVEESDTEKFGKDYLLIDEYGKKIRCLNNLSNRPYRSRNAAKIKQEILHLRWKLNLESMIIGETGALISCQHRLIGLILAAQAWLRDELGNEFPEWKSEPVMPCLIAFGCSEADDVVNTVDTGEPRSIADVIYRTGFFDEFNDHQNEQLSRILDYGIRFLWARNGLWDAYSPYKTHAEAMDLLNKHPRLIECAKHIYAENGGMSKKISQHVATGTAAGLMYIMGASATDSKSYELLAEESSIEWDYWDQAVEFWVSIAGKAKGMNPLFKALGNLGEFASRDERTSLIILAWQCIVGGDQLTLKDLQLKYETRDEMKVLAELPTIGGIDMPSWAKVQELHDEE